MPQYSKLLVWNHARTLVQQVTAATRGVRGEGDLISQIRRASISVAANIAEGAERGSSRELDIAGRPGHTGALYALRL
jgi:hypothetical protein